MANISVLSRLINGVQRNVDLSANTLVVNVLKVVSTDLTQTILNNLINQQNGSDFATGTNSHTHDARYYTQTQIAATTGSALVGDSNTYSNFTPSAATAKGAFSGIDTKLGTIAANNSFTDSLFNVYNNSDNTKKIFLDASGIAASTSRTLKMANADVDLANLTNSNISVSAAIAYSKLNLSGAISNSDINAAAAIAYSKLNLSTSIMNADINASAGITYNKLNLTNSIVNADISVAAAITYSKLSLSNTIKASDQDSQSATSVQPLFANGSGGSTYRSIVSGDLPDLSSIYVNVSQKAANNGVATLDAGGKIPATQLPNTVMEYQQAWNPNTNTPTVVDGVGNTGDVYRVSTADAGTVAGLTDPSMSGFQAGDFIIYSGTLSKWQRAPASDGVVSVNGQQGVVTVNAINQLTGDVAAGPASGSQSVVATIQPGVVTAAKLSTVTDGITLDQSGAGSTLEIKTGGVGATQLASQAVTSAKIATTALDQTTITGGNGTTLAVVASPRGVKSVVAGEAMNANTSYLVRYAMNGETAGRVYKADQDATSLDKFYAVGVVLSGSAISAGNTISATYSGTHILGSSDTPFAGTDIGKAVYLTASGAFSVTPPSTVNFAVWRMGIVENTDRIWVNTLQLNGIN